MSVEWDIIESGPPDAAHGVLLLPGGGCPAAEYGPVMEQPQLRHLRLVAATLPGHAGARPPLDFSVPSYAEEAARVAREHRCDVVVGFSMGATIALEMALSGKHTGPVVLLGISMSAEDEPGFFRALVRVSPRLGGRPVGLLMRLSAMAARRAKAPAEHRAAMAAGLRRNDGRVLGQAMTAYLDHLTAGDAAQRLCEAGVPAWVVHTEKGGDGGLTAAERETLSGCGSVHLVTLPGASFLLPDERPAEVADVIAEAVLAAG